MLVNGSFLKFFVDYCAKLFWKLVPTSSKFSLPGEKKLDTYKKVQIKK